MYLKVTMFGFSQRFGRILYFCSKNGPLLNVILSTLYLEKFSVRLKIKIERNNRMISPTVSLKLPEQGKTFKLENLLFMIYVEKTSNFEDVPPLSYMYHAKKHFDNLLKR